MSLAEKRALADQLRGELSQLRVEKEAALHEASGVAAEAQIDDELVRLKAERDQAQLELEVAKNGGSVEDAMAAMKAAAAIAENPFSAEEQKLESPAPVMDAPALVDTENQDGGK